MRWLTHRTSVTLLLVVLLVGVASAPSAQDLPSPEGYINDFAGVIPAEDAAAMRGIITAVERQTGATIAVVTVPSFAPYPTIEDFGIALAEAWGVGSASGDTGVILILALEERRVRLEVGYGLEGAIPDGRAGSILDDYVIPDFRDGRYGAGFLNGVAALAVAIGDEYGVTISGVEPQPRGEPSRSGPDLGDLFYLVFLLLFVGGRWFFWPLLFTGRRRGFYGGGLRSSGRGGPPRFSGFGGGGFGGGGASRGF